VSRLFEEVNLDLRGTGDIDVSTISMSGTMANEISLVFLGLDDLYFLYFFKDRLYQVKKLQ